MDEGGPATFDAFFADQQHSLVRYATVLSGSRAQAEELVQEVLVRMYQRWDVLLERDGSLPAYARRAVTNEHLSWRRSWSTRHVRVVPDEELDVRSTAPPETGVDDALWESVRSLGSRQRAAIVLRYLEGYDDAEIAEILGCAQVTVRSLVSRGLRALRAGLAAHPREGSPGHGR